MKELLEKLSVETQKLLKEVKLNKLVKESEVKELESTQLN